MNAATEDAFPYGADVRVLDPAAGKGAEAAQQEASEAAQVRTSILPTIAPHRETFPAHTGNLLAQHREANLWTHTPS